jgi:Recombinase/Resolvase, N terminal domain/Recombinase zinc beta ribbon domain
MARHDAVLIRVSTDEQEYQGQIDNVRRMLSARHVQILDIHWFVYTVSRRKVSNHPRFKEFIAQVEAGEIGTAYVESRDRFGHTDPYDYFKIITTLCENESGLISLRDDKDLTERSMIADVEAVFNTASNDAKIREAAYQSLRTRANSFQTTGSWPTGPHPFGYGKRCFSAGGQLQWEWQPISRTLGITSDFNSSGVRRKRNDEPAKLPRKERTDIIKLVPSDNKKFVKAVQRAFDFYVRAGLSRRRISQQLNADGLTFYNQPFSHSYVTQILDNPAYAGDTHFGKTQPGELCTFDAQGSMTELKRTSKNGNSKVKKRTAEERIVKQNTHDALIDRDTWDAAQAKLASERSRTSFAPRNPAYYLKPLFVCGHCGKNLTGRIENQGKVVYVCSTYIKGRTGGYSVQCGYHRISHKIAQQLLFDKIDELGLRYDFQASDGVRNSLVAQIRSLEYESDDLREQYWNSIKQGTTILVDYFKETYQLDQRQLKLVEMAGMRFYRIGKLRQLRTQEIPIEFDKFKNAIKVAEKAAVSEAVKKLAELNQEHEAYTKAWVKATDKQKAVIQKELVKLEADIDEWKPRTITMSERLHEIHKAENERSAQRNKLIAEWPQLDCREKGEAMRRLFKTIKLYWKAIWHPNEESTTRQRKTERKGRFSYELLTDKIEWNLEKSTLVGSW